MIRKTMTALLSAALLWSGLTGGGVAAAGVSTTPAATPQLATSGTDGSIETVRQIVQCGGTMYAVGLFSAVKDAGTSASIARRNAFAFSATAPYKVLPWNPNTNGRVDTAACTPDGHVLIGGSFTSAGGAAVSNLAKVDGVTGLNRGFGFGPKGRVAHVEVVTDAGGVQHALVGGYFTGLLDSRNPVTGANDNYATPAISGTYVYPNAASNAPRIWNMTVSPNGRAVLMTGVFTKVGGQRHEQVFRLNLNAGGSAVSTWSPQDLYAHCAPSQPFYAQDAAFSPDMSQVYVVSTGLRLASEIALPASQRPAKRTGPCDAAMAFTAKEGVFTGHRWINYTGCDSLYSVAADAQTVFIGGHQKFISNPNVCGGTAPGPGGIVQPGLGALEPATGAHQPSASRGRGLGAADMLRTTSGLWIASDNQANTDDCAGVHGRTGICFLPN